MPDYQLGYEYYKDACIKHHLEPVNLHYFLLNLSEQQLDAFIVHAMQNRGQYALTM